MIEVIVGSVIIMLIMLSATAVLVLGMRQLRDARATTEVSQIVDSEYENLRKLNYSTLVSDYGLSDTVGSSKTVDLTSSALAGGFTAPSDFAMSANFTTLASAAGDSSFGMIELSLTTTWTDPTGRPQREVSYTRFSELGLSDYVVIGF